MAGAGILVTWPSSGFFLYYQPAPPQTYKFSWNGSVWNQEAGHLGLTLGSICPSLRPNQIPIFRGEVESLVFKPNELQGQKKDKRGKQERREVGREGGKKEVGSHKQAE